MMVFMQKTQHTQYYLHGHAWDRLFVKPIIKLLIVLQHRIFNMKMINHFSVETRRMFYLVFGRYLLPILWDIGILYSHTLLHFCILDHIMILKKIKINIHINAIMIISAMIDLQWSFAHQPQFAPYISIAITLNAKLTFGCIANR